MYKQDWVKVVEASSQMNEEEREVVKVILMGSIAESLYRIANCLEKENK